MRKSFLLSPVPFNIYVGNNRRKRKKKTYGRERKKLTAIIHMLNVYISRLTSAYMLYVRINKLSNYWIYG